MNNAFQFLLYRSEEEDVAVSAVVKDETIWLTQKGMAELFGVQTPAISKHLHNIFMEGELDEAVVVSKMEITTPHGAMDGKTQTHETKFYNLDAIISVGYRVNSRRATHFRIWATGVLKEYITKGFVLDDDRLKQGQTAFGKDYFRELLERVRSIRASERRIWQQITDIFAECSIDYDKDAPVTHAFYAMVQNKFHYAITGQTAAEIIYAGADRNAVHHPAGQGQGLPPCRRGKGPRRIRRLQQDPEDRLRLRPRGPAAAAGRGQRVKALASPAHLCYTSSQRARRALKSE